MAKPQTHRHLPSVSTAFIERRVWVRFPCNLDTSCHPVGQSAELKWPGTVQNISQGGVCLRLNRRFECGTILTVQLQDPNGTPSGTHLARVVHLHADGHGEWLMGCAFIHELSEDELHALVPDAQ
jgi:hypothetical protein